MAEMAGGKFQTQSSKLKGNSKFQVGHLSFLQTSGVSVRPEGSKKIAQHLSAGLNAATKVSPGGTKETLVEGFCRPSGTGRSSVLPPSTQVLGYFQSSLRDVTRFRSGIAIH